MFGDGSQNGNLTYQQTDSTRSRNLELQYQTRLKRELEKIRDLEASRLDQLSERLTSMDHDSNDSTTTGSATANTEGRQAQQAQQKDSKFVAREVAALKSKLDGRKKLEKADAGVEEARSELVACLQTNEARPLDCWAEVERFKGQVARYEARFLERTLRP